ncbi:hypothetical protein BHE74_00010484 [Ensete ventricosum]|nr:hypothetical protein BHE74_00010484 [Ensete ventricosum]
MHGPGLGHYLVPTSTAPLPAQDFRRRHLSRSHYSRGLFARGDHSSKGGSHVGRCLADQHLRLFGGTFGLINKDPDREQPPTFLMLRDDEGDITRESKQGKAKEIRKSKGGKEAQRTQLWKTRGRLRGKEADVEGTRKRWEN